MASFVLTPSTRSQRDRLLRMGGLFFAAALPVAVVLVLIINWWVAIGYVVLQTTVLTFGVRQQRTSVLKVDERGLQYQASTFVLRAGWDELDRVEEVTLPSGPTQAFMTNRSALRWTHTAEVRAQVLQRGWDRVIPIDEFEPSWPKGRLAEAVREHRPDLLPDL